MDCEEWALCTANTDYEVSNMGRVRRATSGPSTSVGRLLKTSLSHKGYEQIKINVDGKSKSLTVHRLVALAWIQNPLSLATVNHKDGDKRNNRVCNLEWCSNSDNIKHAFVHGLKGIGESHEKAILSTLDVLDVRRHLIAGESLSTVGNRFGVSQWAIHNIVRGLTWKHVPTDPEWTAFLSERRSIYERSRRFDAGGGS